MDVTSNLREFLENGEDWERKNTNIPGVAIIRLPSTKARSASLAIEINPLDENGRPIKKKGVMIMSDEEIRAFRGIFENPKLGNLVEALEEILPEKKGQKKTGGVIEI